LRPGSGRISAARLFMFPGYLCFPAIYFFKTFFDHCFGVLRPLFSGLLVGEVIYA
jgi:hypothetical protein